MTISTTKNRFAVLVAGITLIAASAFAQDNPHWNKSKCSVCHTEVAPVAGATTLTAANTEELCSSCHGDRGDAIPCRHASGIPVGDMPVPETLAGSLQDGQVVCSTCHDIVYQCERPQVHASLMNPGFLRDRTSHESSGYCLKCHDSSGLEKLSPHAGTAGSPPRATCELCHSSVPATSATGQLVVEFNMKDELNDMCLGCHTVSPHPRGMSFGTSREEEGWVHLVNPSEKVLEKMRVTQAETGIVLPLNPQSGEVFCATCHNPHDFKVGGAHGSEVQGAKKRLRMNRICLACHDK